MVTNTLSAPLQTSPDAILAILSTQPTLIALDRDGTLVPYADRPENALVDDSLRQILANLVANSGTFVAIVSARSLVQLQRDFGGLNMILAGNYGLEILHPGHEPLVNAQALASQPHLRVVIETLRALTAPSINCILEDHGLSACLHFHSVPANQITMVHECIAALPKFDDLLIKELPTSYEILPNVSHGKGDALTAIEQTLAIPLTSVIFAGDTEPDETAFAWVNARGGISIKVGDNPSSSCAQFGLHDVTAMRQFLTLLPDRTRLLGRVSKSS